MTQGLRAAWIDAGIGTESAQMRAVFSGSVTARGRRVRLPTQGGGFLFLVRADAGGTQVRA